MNPDADQGAEAGLISPATGIARDGIPKDTRSVSTHPEIQNKNTPEVENLMERVVGRKNMMDAYARVVGNKGSAGVDGISVEKLREYLKTRWDRIKEDLLAGRYQPKPVRGVEIPKPNGGVRMLGIPTVVDRLIQQALNQVLSPIFEPGFSESSYGFRPGKSAVQAVLKAKEFQQDGKRWVVDMDLAKFFDEVDHDILMTRVKRKVRDRMVLKLIGAYLKAGVMKDGTLQARKKGTPQGGNLSPLLANILLDELDKQLEERGHTFCRYADDCNIYVRSEKAGLRVMAWVTKFVEQQLKLKVNREKSAVARPWERKFLGYTVTRERNVRLKVASESRKKLTGNLKHCFRMGRGRNLKRFIREDLNPKIRGWINYFIHSEVKSFAEELDGWIRRKLRCLLWRQWKRNWTRRNRLIEAGLDENQAAMSAFNQRGPWWNSGASHMNKTFPKKFFDQLGLVSMLDRMLEHLKVCSRTAVY